MEKSNRSFTSKQSLTKKGDATNGRPAQDIEEQRATDPTEEKTCTVNNLTDNELRFRDMNLPKVSAEHAKRV